MRRFPGIALAGFLLLAVAAGFTALALRPLEGVEARRARIADLAQAGGAKGDWPGLMWAEVAPGRIVALGAAGFADIAGARPMSTDTIMPIGSISKVIAGLAGAQAVHAGARPGCSARRLPEPRRRLARRGTPQLQPFRDPYVGHS